MKKWSIVILGVCFALFMFVSVAKAKECSKFHKWPMKRCAAAIIVMEGVYFDSGSAKIKAVSYKILDENVTILNSRNNKKKSFVITGYTDNVGNANYNKKLSQSRAESIMNYFASKGVDGKRMTAVGMGEANPIATNSTAAGRAKNRRIEVEFK
jgi:OmpA-OmpF porin, OOP family